MPKYDASLYNPPAPVAMVGIRNGATGESANDVPMLIDSGADVTVVPESFVLRLNISFEEDSNYEVEGFDGHRGIARSAKMHLLLSNLTFRGQFLVVAQPCGYLGRNLLNQIRISLLGPELIWSLIGQSGLIIDLKKTRTPPCSHENSFPRSCSSSPHSPRPRLPPIRPPWCHCRHRSSGTRAIAPLGLGHRDR